MADRLHPERVIEMAGIRIQPCLEPYTNPFRKMVYDTNEEMNKVIGKLADNSFIAEKAAELKQFKKEVEGLKRKLKLK